jgi:hypothetical protein
MSLLFSSGKTVPGFENRAFKKKRREQKEEEMTTKFQNSVY